MSDIKRKLTSRKFWVTIATILASVGSAINGLYTDDKVLVIIGLVCTVISSSIYTIAESCVDSSAAMYYNEADFGEESEG